jgi:hypothetical protein
MGAEDIGSWQTVFEVMAVVCVVTHAGFIVYTMDTKIRDYGPVQKAFIFIGYQVSPSDSVFHVFLSLIPDVTGLLDIVGPLCGHLAAEQVGTRH